MTTWKDAIISHQKNANENHNGNISHLLELKKDWYKRTTAKIGKDVEQTKPKWENKIATCFFKSLLVFIQLHVHLAFDLAIQKNENISTKRLWMFTAALITLAKMD